MASPTSSPFSDDAIEGQIQQNPQILDQTPTTPQQPVKKDSGLNKVLLAGMLGGDLADALSTNINPRGEFNPLLPQPGIGNFLGIMGTGVAKALLANKLAHSHPNLAKTLGAGSIGVSGYDTINNIMSKNNHFLWPFNTSGK